MADGEAEFKQPCVAKTFGKFQHPDFTADGKARAIVPLASLETLWVNTGTLCNVECAHCYIESSPANDRLVYLTATELAPFLEEAQSMGATEIGFTGGEPFLNPDMIPMARAALEKDLSVLILTNAMRPMMRPQVQEGLLALREQYGNRISLRVSIDHYGAQEHDRERGQGSFAAGIEGLCWLQQHNFSIAVAGRTFGTENEEALRQGFAKLFADHAITIDAFNPLALVLFPEMDEDAPVPEITTECWDILGKDPRDVMCSNARMLVKRKGAAAPSVLACTLLAYDEQFELGATLKEAARPVKLNHPHCAKFCVLGGASCSG